jgi:pantothenate kinase type III
MFNIQKNLLQSLASGTQCEPLGEIQTTSENISSGGRGKIRKILTQYHSKYYFPELGKYHYHTSLNFHNSRNSSTYSLIC